MKNKHIVQLAMALLLVSAACGVRHTKQQYRAIRVLMVGGGSSHDFDRWYRQADATTLRSQGLCTVTYTTNVDSIPAYLRTADVLYLVTNQPMTNTVVQKAIFDFADAGKGLILGHPGLWYNWKNWPEYNRILVSGGASEHDRYGSFEETIVNINHPVTKGVDKTFILKDERYHYILDPAGPGIEVLASNSVNGSDKIYPSVFVVKHPRARIVCIALGHDAASHDIVPYQLLLRNAVKWVAHQ